MLSLKCETQWESWWSNQNDSHQIWMKWAENESNTQILIQFKRDSCRMNQSELQFTTVLPKKGNLIWFLLSHPFDLHTTHPLICGCTLTTTTDLLVLVLLESELSLMSMSMLPPSYHCDCSRYCKYLKKVSKANSTIMLSTGLKITTTPPSQVMHAAFMY